MVSPIRPYAIDVYNRITGDRFAWYRSNQVPAKSDLLNVYPSIRNEDDPFHQWGQWVVDVVVWNVASATSVTARAVARESGGDMSAAYCERVELHVWPAQGPHWCKTPRFAKVLTPYDDDDEDAGAVVVTPAQEETASDE